MTDLRPADPVELRRVLARALRHRRDGRRTQDHVEVMSLAAAEHLAEALRLAGFVVMQGPGAPAHTGPAGFRQGEAGGGR